MEVRPPKYNRRRPLHDFSVSHSHREANDDDENSNSQNSELEYLRRANGQGAHRLR